MNEDKVSGRVLSSFRDPSGFLFYREGLLYRQINIAYRENYECLMNSGLYKALVDDGLLIPHQEVDVKYAQSAQAYKVIRPESVPFISYPYEWCFSQLKDAALATLKIQKRSLEFGMSLKDCSAYNIQFIKGNPVIIDTLSFEKYQEGSPWVAYRQFCQHFLAPLALMSYKDIRLGQLSRVFIDGIPLDLASSLFPLRTYFTLSLLFNIHLHAKSQKHFANKGVDVRVHKISRVSFLGLIGNLESVIKKLKWQPKGTEWADYYEDTNYQEQALRHKKKLVSEFLDKISPNMVWDLGANIGVFSRVCSEKGIKTISFDIDAAAVERNYLACKKDEESNILPLLIDLTNPSPAIGWENQERMSLFERGPADTVLALALIHHLAITNNTPFDKIAEFCSKICNSLIIEFIPKEDAQVKRILFNREDIFDDYSEQSFELAFGRFFNLQQSVRINQSLRTIYLMGKK